MNNPTYLFYLGHFKGGLCNVVIVIGSYSCLNNH